MPEIRQFSESRIAIDDRYAPLVITTWSGRSDLEAARWATETQTARSREMLKRFDKVLSISEASDAERPGPDVRRFFADSVTDTPEEIKKGTLETYVVITSAMIRGALTAVGWISQEVRKIKSVGSIEHALELAFADLDAAGIPRPPGLSPGSYTPPPGYEPWGSVSETGAS